MKAIANLKKIVLLQVVVVWKPCAECPGDGPTWRKCCSKNYSLVRQTVVNAQIVQFFKWQYSFIRRFIDHKIWDIHAQKRLNKQLLSWSGLSLQRYKSLNMSENTWNIDKHLQTHCQSYVQPPTGCTNYVQPTGCTKSVLPRAYKRREGMQLHYLAT